MVHTYYEELVAVIMEFQIEITQEMLGSGYDWALNEQLRVNVPGTNFKSGTCYRSFFLILQKLGLEEVNLILDYVWLLFIDICMEYENHVTGRWKDYFIQVVWL